MCGGYSSGYPSPIVQRPRASPGGYNYIITVNIVSGQATPFPLNRTHAVTRHYHYVSCVPCRHYTFMEKQNT